jgi:hypothetical protein
MKKRTVAQVKPTGAARQVAQSREPAVPHGDAPGRCRCARFQIRAKPRTSGLGYDVRPIVGRRRRIAARVVEELFVRAHTLVAANRIARLETDTDNGKLNLYYTQEVRVEVKPEEPKP